ncbi:MAG: hypothetical protein ACOC42_01765 [Halobacteriota archaeon]
MDGTFRLYGAAIAIVSGAYSLWSASMAAGFDVNAWLMLVLGAVVVIHGVLMLTQFADRLNSISGPLMVGYALIMLAHQALLGLGMMGTEGGTAMEPARTTMAFDGGMVALAALMLVSGVLMVRAPARGRM